MTRPPLIGSMTVPRTMIQLLRRDLFSAFALTPVAPSGSCLSEPLISGMNSGSQALGVSDLL